MLTTPSTKICRASKLTPESWSLTCIMLRVYMHAHATCMHMLHVHMYVCTCYMYVHATCTHMLHVRTCYMYAHATCVYAHDDVHHTLEWIEC